MVTMFATVADIRLEANGSRSTLVRSRLARMIENSRMTKSMTVPICLRASPVTPEAVPRLVPVAPVTTDSSSPGPGPTAMIALCG